MGNERTRVLVIEDDDVLRAALVRALLDRDGCVVCVVAGAAAALAALREEAPHLVVADMDAGGAELLAAVGPTPDGRAGVPFIALSRQGDLTSRLAAFERGADDVLALPFSPEELLARVNVLMRRSYAKRIPMPHRIRGGNR
jgi:DNA-binding response OmpR family regulator